MMFAPRRLFGVLLAATTLFTAGGCFVLVVHKGDGPPEGRIRHITPGDSFEGDIQEGPATGQAASLSTDNTENTKPAGSEPSPAKHD